MDRTGTSMRVTSTFHRSKDRRASPRLLAPTCHWKNLSKTTSWVGSKKPPSRVVAPSRSPGNRRSAGGVASTRSRCQSMMGVLATTARIRRSYSAARSTMYPPRLSPYAASLSGSTSGLARTASRMPDTGTSTSARKRRPSKAVEPCPGTSTAITFQPRAMPVAPPQKYMSSAYVSPPPISNIVGRGPATPARSEEHTSELQSRQYLVCRLLLEKKKKNRRRDANRDGELTGPARLSRRVDEIGVGYH